MDYLGRKASHAQCPKCGKLTVLSTPYTFITRGLCAVCSQPYPKAPR